MSDVELSIDIQLKEANKKLATLGKQLDQAALKGRKLGDANKKAADKSSKAFQKMGKGLAVMAAGWVSVNAAQKAYQLSATSAKAKDAIAVFEAAGGSVAKLRQQTRGLISDATLARNANLARTMGIDSDQFAKLANIANAAAKSTGESSEFMLESIVKGTARSSKLLLDNLGILVSVGSANEAYAKKVGKTTDALTDYDKKQAFINATLEAGVSVLDDVAAAGANSAEAFDRAEAKFENAANALGNVMRPAIAAVINDIADLAQDWANLMDTTASDKAARVHGRAKTRDSALNMARKAAGKGFESAGLKELQGLVRSGRGGLGASLSGSMAMTTRDDPTGDKKRFQEFLGFMRASATLAGRITREHKGSPAPRGGGAGGKGGRGKRGKASLPSFDSQGGVGFDPSSGFAFDDTSAEDADFEKRARMREFLEGEARFEAKRLEDKAKASAQAAEVAEAQRLEAQDAEFARLDALEEARMLAAERVAAHQQAINDRLHQEAMGATRASIGIAVDLAQRATEMFMSGEEHALEQLAALGLARVGTEFVAKGSLFAAEGVGMAIAGNVPGGIALGALGVGMIGTGIGMGAGSMAITQSLPKGMGSAIGDAVSSGAVTNRGNGAENIGASTQTQIVVNYGVNGPHPDETAKAIVSGLNLAQRRGITATR